MPWLSIIMALISFFAAGGAKKENRAKAAAIGLGVGAATYGVTHYTDWGQENLGQWDGVSLEGSGSTATATTSDGTKVPVTTSPTTATGSTGVWGTLGNWLSSGAGQLTTGLAGASALGIPKWALIGGGLLAVYLILRK